jgi:hypothetical protein
MEWINFAQFRDKWPAFVNMNTSSPVFKMLGIYTRAEEMLTSENWLCSTELVSWLVSYLVSQSVRPVSVSAFHVQAFCLHVNSMPIPYITVLWNHYFFFRNL